MDEVVVDGKANDWAAGGFRVELLAPLHGAPKAEDDFDARVRLGWNARGLLMMGTVHDDKPVEHEAEDLLWQYDAVEVYMATHRGAPDVCQWVIAPGVAKDQPKLRWRFYDYRKDEKLKKLPAELDAARTRTVRQPGAGGSDCEGMKLERTGSRTVPSAGRVPVPGDPNSIQGTACSRPRHP